MRETKQRLYRAHLELCFSVLSFFVGFFSVIFDRIFSLTVHKAHIIEKKMALNKEKQKMSKFSEEM